MNEWDIVTSRIIDAIKEVRADNRREEIIRLAVLSYLCKSLKDEETFNNNCEILNSVRYEEIKNKRR